MKKVDSAVQSVTAASNVKRKLIISQDSESSDDDDMVLASKFKISKKAVDSVTDVLVIPEKPKKRRRLLKQSKYYIPLEIQNSNVEVDATNDKVDSGTDTDAHPVEPLNSDVQVTPPMTKEIAISPVKSQLQSVHISDSTTSSPSTPNRVEIPWEKVIETARQLGCALPPLMEKRKVSEKVFTRSKKQRKSSSLDGLSTQEPGSQSDSAAQKEGQAPQEPLTQSVSAGSAEGMVTQEPLSQSEGADNIIPATQELFSQCEDTGKAA